MHLTRERIKTPLEALIYYADCAVATYAESLIVKRFSQANRTRYGRIAEDMTALAETFVKDGWAEGAEWHQKELAEEVARVRQRLTDSKAHEAES